MTSDRSRVIRLRFQCPTINICRGKDPSKILRKVCPCMRKIKSPEEKQIAIKKRLSGQGFPKSKYSHQKSRIDDKNWDELTTFDKIMRVYRLKLRAWTEIGLNLCIVIVMACLFIKQMTVTDIGLKDCTQRPFWIWLIIIAISYVIKLFASIINLMLDHCAMKLIFLHAFVMIPIDIIMIIIGHIMISDQSVFGCNGVESIEQSDTIITHSYIFLALIYCKIFYYIINITVFILMVKLTKQTNKRSLLMRRATISFINIQKMLNPSSQNRQQIHQLSTNPYQDTQQQPFEIKGGGGSIDRFQEGIELTPTVRSVSSQSDFEKDDLIQDQVKNNIKFGKENTGIEGLLIQQSLSLSIKQNSNFLEGTEMEIIHKEIQIEGFMPNYIESASSRALCAIKLKCDSEISTVRIGDNDLNETIKQKGFDDLGDLTLERIDMGPNFRESFEKSKYNIDKIINKQQEEDDSENTQQ